MGYMDRICRENEAGRRIMNARLRLIFIFTAKVVLIAPFVWLLWWWILPHYAWSIGQIGGTIIIYLGRMPIEAMRIESNEALILNANTILIFTYNQLEYPFDVTSLVSNIPPFLILVGATPSIRFRRAIPYYFCDAHWICCCHLYLPR